jgi:hypothetical protein
MGDQTQAYDIFQTPLSSGYPLPLRIHSGIQKEVRVIPGTAKLTADSSFILMFSYFDISVYFSPHFVCAYAIIALKTELVPLLLEQRVMRIRLS